MTTKADFNADEWERIAQAPAFAGLMVILADRGGTIRESIALGKAYAEARRDGGSELLEQVVASPPHVDPKSIGRPISCRSGSARRSASWSRRPPPRRPRSTASSSCAWRTSVAHAHKEGGVLGIGGKEVSEQEQAVLDELARLVSS